MEPDVGIYNIHHLKTIYSFQFQIHNYAMNATSGYGRNYNLLSKDILRKETYVMRMRCDIEYYING